MATVKLKDVLKSLPQDTNLTGSEMVVINDNGENKYIPYSTIKSGLVNAQERSTLANSHWPAGVLANSLVGLAVEASLVKSMANPV